MSFIYSIFSWLYNTFVSYLPFRLAANPSESVVREQIQQQAIAQNNQSLQDLIVDIISHLPSVEEILTHHNSETVNEEQITTSIHELIPQLFDKSFREAIDFCKNNDQILLVYLHSPGHDDSYDFIQNIFCKKEFIEFLNTNFVVFSSSIKSSEGYSISNQLQATSYPFLAVLLGNQVHWRMDGLTELKNLTEMSNGQTHIIDNLMTQLIEVHERLDSQLVIQRQEKLQREYERRAREEQDRAYEESLRIDREKEEKRLAVERERQAKIDNFMQKLRNNESTRSEIRNNIVFYNNEAEYKNIKLKLPNGSELQRKFSLHLTFGDLHRFIHAYPSTEWQPSRYSKVETDYELTLNSFPKRPIPFDDSQSLSSIEGKALFIFVREAEHDDDAQFAAEHSL